MTKKLVALGVVGVAAVVVFPGLLQYAPLLLIAICPLSMLLMGHGGHMGMGGHAGHGSEQPANAGASGSYTCPMHPEVRSDQPGRCPKCGMALKAAVASTGGVEELETRLRSLSEQQAALAAEIERVKNKEAPASRSKVVREAEEVARAAEAQEH